MSIWAEAYDLPHLADPGKKIAWLPALDGRFGKHVDVFREEGSVTLPSAYDRLGDVLTIDPDDHSNDVGSVIHFFERGVVGSDGLPIPIGSFVTERRPDDLQSQATGRTQLSGRGLTSYFLDRVRLWPFDHPNNPTQEGDWIFGGENLLTNPGFEDGNPQNEEWAIWLDEDVDGGTWSLSIIGNGMGELRDDLDWDITTSELQSEVEFADNVISASVSGEGTEENPWIIRITDPGDEPYNFVVSDIDLTNGTIHSERQVVGGSPDISGWTRSVNLANRGQEHGTYASDGFRLSYDGEPVRTGDYSLRINGLTRFAGAMQVLNVVPGHRYTASIWVRTSDPDLIMRLVFRDRFERYISGPNGLGGFTLAANTWTEITHEFVVPEGVTQIIFRIAVVGHVTEGDEVNPVAFYIDDAFFGPGTGPATVGDIWEQLLLDAQTDHNGEGRDALSWLVPTFTELVDSNGDAWDTERRVTLQVDDTYGQIAEALQNAWGYVHRIYYDREDNLYYFDVFNPGYEEVDHSTTDTGTLIVGMNVLGGEMIQRAPEATHFKARGDGDIWSEGTATSLLASWGWADGAVQRVATSDQTDLDAVVTQQLARNLERMFTFEATMNDQSQVRPFHEFDVLHRVGINLGDRSNFPFSDMVVTSIVTSFTPGKAPNHQIFVNSDAFASTGAAALAEAVRRLLRKSQRQQRFLGGPAAIGAGQGGVPRIVLAASNASAESQAKADFVCSGTDDLELFKMIALLFDDGVGGELRLTEGFFNPAGPVCGSEGDITWDDTFITGAGRAVTAITEDIGNWTMLSTSGFRDLSFVDPVG